MYDSNGYLDFNYIIEHSLTYTFIVGGRGIGKTFGALKYVLDNDIKFIFLRRTQTQIDMIKNEDLNPFRALEAVLGDDYATATKKINKNITACYRAERDADGILQPHGKPIGYLMALSTIANIRGFNASDVDMLIYDEFIGEKHEARIQHEGTAFLNAIETIARNREISGGKPLRVLGLSNSNMLANPLFVELQIVTECERMLKKSQTIRNVPARDLTLIMLNTTPVSEKKAQTSLYKLAGRDSSFSKMALDNEFTAEEMNDIKSLSLKEYKPVVSVGELNIYRHKSRNEYYITGHTSGSPSQYDTSPMELKRFKHDWYYLWLAYMRRAIIFESYIYKVLFEKYYEL